MKKLRKYLILTPFFFWLFALILIPLVLVLYLGFVPSDGESGFSLSNFERLLDPVYISIILRSLWLALIATAICLVVGYPIAAIMASERNRNKAWLPVLFIIPMWMNFLLRTYAWMSLLENTGLVNQLLGLMGIPAQQFLYNETAVVLGMVYNLLPYMIFPIYTSISKIPTDLLEAAGDLGANGWQRLWKVTVPLSKGGIISGITMVYVPSITSFAISRLLGGGKVSLVGDFIENQFRTIGDMGFGSAMSIVVMLIVLLSMWMTNKWSDEGEGTMSVW